MTMENNEVNVEEALAEINERVEEIDKGAEKQAEKVAKVFKYFDVAHTAVGVIGFGAVVGLVIKESMK